MAMATMSVMADAMIQPHSALTGPPQYQAMPHEPVMDVRKDTLFEGQACREGVRVRRLTPRGRHATHMLNDMPKLVSAVRPRLSSCGVHTGA